MVERIQLIGPLPNIGARRVAWDRTGRFAITLTDDYRLLGLSPSAEVFEVEAQASTELIWDPAAPLLTVVGASLLVDSTGRALVDSAGGQLALSPSGQLVSIHGADDECVVADYTGSVLMNLPGVAHAEWATDDDRLLVVDRGGVGVYELPDYFSMVVDNEGGVLFADWSASSTSMVLWGPYGSFDVRSASGDLLMSFPAHEGSINLGAGLGSTLLATSGDDRRVMLYDLVRRGVHGCIDLPAPAVDLSFDPTERFLAVSTLDGQVLVFDTSSLKLITRPGSESGQAVWSPNECLLACCDGADLWLEIYD